MRTPLALDSWLSRSWAHQTIPAILATTLLACATSSEPSDPASCEGKCDGPEALDLARPDEAAVARLLADGFRDGALDEHEAAAVASFTKAASGRNQRIAAVLRTLADTDDRLTPAALEVLEVALGAERPTDVPLENAVYRLALGTRVSLEDDTLFLIGDGAVQADTGLRSHSRGYAAKRDGVLFTRHGSLAPHHDKTGTLADTTALRARTPDSALDMAAVTAGIQLSQFTTFAATAHSPAYFDPSPNTPFWAGICQGWTHNALDNRLSVLVDPPGMQGARGLWIFGQWISRADLGNAMMGASYSLGIADSITIDSFVKPESLLKALAQHVLRSGTGLRVDIWNDEHNSSGTYNAQIWNQPIVGGGIEVASVSDAVRTAVLAYAAARPTWVTIPADARVKRVRAQARWGAETNDAWEDEARFKQSTWNMYLVTDASGQVLRGFMANQLARDGVAGLPVTTSDGLPDYVAVPRHEFTDASLTGAPHRLLGTDNPEGARFRFVIGTVLARGIPEPTRVAFEAEALQRGVDAVALAKRYPGIANAYSPEQWKRVFESQLGPGTKFGAVWRQ